MRSLLGDLMPLVLGGMLVWTGATKLFVRSVPRQAGAVEQDAPLGSRSAVPRPAQPSDPGDATRGVPVVSRGVAWIELALGLTLLEFPTSSEPATATVLLTIGYLGYLGYVSLAVPPDPTGPTAVLRPPVTWRCFVRAGLVAVGGILATQAATPWWMAVAMHPVAAAGIVLLVAVVLTALSTHLDHLWLLPLRRARVRSTAMSDDPPARGNPSPSPVTGPLELDLLDSRDGM